MSERKKPEEPQEEGAPAWMNTYGDMVTLVLTFFVLLFSFSSVDAKKWSDVATSLSGMKIIAIPALDPYASDKMAKDVQGKFVLTSTSPSAVELDLAGNETGMTAEEINKVFNEMYEKIKSHIERNNLGGILELKYVDEFTVLLRMADSAFFDSGSASLRDDAQAVLQEVCGILVEYSDLIKKIRVEGYTDNVPMHNAKFEDNWDLSVGRATSVVRYLTKATALDPSLFVPAGHGEFSPIADNNTDEGRAKNRRVDFVIESILKK
ncbi:MAG: flagellar motor protein MotB [Burkholderiales bacterium]